MKHFCSLLIVGATAITLMSADLPQGLSGSDLALAVRQQYAPAKSVSGYDAVPGWWGDYVTTIVPASWWNSAPNDLYNYIKATGQFELARTDYPPGDVVDVLQSNENWAVGVGRVGESSTNFWCPEPSRQGDVARRYMYMALMYPQELWRGRGVMIFEDGGWPLLTAYGINVLLSWHRADPVSDTELAECAAIEDAQGNANPFVLMPELAEYLCGEQAGQLTGEVILEPLKAVYSRATDAKINLVSPYVPADAAWQLDGTKVDEYSISIANLAIGTHELSFTSDSAVGSLIITIGP
jgi:hypothetical protein